MQLLLQCKQRLRLANAGKPLTDALTHEQMDKVSYEDVAEMALGKYAKRGIQVGGSPSVLHLVPRTR